MRPTVTSIITFAIAGACLAQTETAVNPEPSACSTPITTQQVCMDGRFDVVVAADVLEHLLDPWNVLRQMISCLGDSGFLVVSLPHAGHNAVIASLLNGDLAYSGAGLLDRTHIRFFGIHNMQALFNGAGLRIVDAHFVSRPPALTELSAQWTRLPAHQREALARNPFGSIYQVVVKLVPAMAPLGSSTGPDGGRDSDSLASSNVHPPGHPGAGPHGAPGGLRLAEMAIPDPRGTSLQRLAGPVWAWLASHLSAAAQERLKTLIKRAGVRV